jgi:hypothetical protein
MTAMVPCSHEFIIRCQENGVFEVCKYCNYVKIIKLKGNKMNNNKQLEEIKIEEAEKIAPKECWASEYTEDERLRAISNYINKCEEDAVKGFAVWMESQVGGLYRGEMERLYQSYLLEKGKVSSDKDKPLFN